MKEDLPPYRAGADTSEPIPAPSSPGKAADTGKGVPPAAVGADTAIAFWSRPHWGFGVGWALGGLPVFALWQSGLPDSLSDFGLQRRMPAAAVGLLDSDSITVVFTIKERPNAYNIGFPVYLIVTPFAGELRRLSLETSVALVRKKFLASLQADSARHRVHMEDALTSLSFSLGASYAHAIPTDYFSVSGIPQAYIVAGMYLRPSTALFRTPSTSSSGPSEEITDLLARAARGVLGRFRSYGLGMGWRLGVAGIKKLSPGNAMDIGVFYTGDWSGVFGLGGDPLRRGDLNTAAGKAQTEFSYFSHMAELRIMFLRGRQNK